MGEKFSLVKLVLLVSTIVLFVNFVHAFDVSSLNPTCTVNSGAQCPVVSDISSGDCRTTLFSSQNGDVKIMSCVKGDSLEIYRQSFPEGVKEACFSNACVDSIKGFESKLISELDLGNIIDVIDPVVDPVQNNTELNNSNNTTGTNDNNIPTTTNSNFAIDPNAMSSLGISYAQVIDKWNDNTWSDVVDSSFATNSNLAAVRWYNTEGQCSGDHCQDQLHNGNGACNDLSVADSKFCGVTDEFSNVLLNHAMGSNQTRYDELHRFAEKLRRPEINNLQCWKYYVTGDKNYNDYNDLCVSKDSASDASIRILGAYGIACAKQMSGEWKVKDIDYCKDYEKQGRAIWGYGTADHGEVKRLSNGQYFLCNGYNNQVNCPAASQSFRPDYYELQFMMDFATYMKSDELKKGVLDMLDFYYSSADIGGNMIHVGKTGSEDIESSGSYVCTDLCTPAYMDNIDSWRAIPALSGLYNVYPDSLNSKEKSLFDYWWNNYLKVNSVDDNKPFEIYSYASDGKVKSSENSYKTLSMWIPLASAKDPTYAKDSVDKLISMYRTDQNQFSGAAYYGGYFSQFAQRAIGSATGMISRSFWTGESVSLPTDSGTNGDVTQNSSSSDSTSSGSGSSSGSTGTQNSGDSTSSGSGSTSSDTSGAVTQTTLEYNSVENMPATCEGGTIVNDEYFGGRRIECISEGGAKLTIEAWDKPNTNNAKYFEMYKKAHIGSGLKICIGNTCISESGYSKSENYPIYFESSINNSEQTLPTEEIPQTSQEVLVGLNSLKIDGKYVEYSCKPEGSSDDLIVDWNFGDGKYVYDDSYKVSHQYSQSGYYTVNCGVWDNQLNKFTTITNSFNIL